MQHADDWRAAGTEFLRIMKPGRNILLAEITFRPELKMKAGLDLHIEYWLEKLFAGVGWNIDEFPFYSTSAVTQAFDGLLADTGTFSWKGVDLFWGAKPA